MEPGLYRGFEYTLRDPGVAYLTFNTPERLNGMNQDIKRDLGEAILQLQMDSRVRVIVFTGQGRAFCAGDDITGRPVTFPDATALMPDLPRGGPPIERISSLRFRSQSINWLIRNIDKPTIAALNGVAVQSGLALALACDFRIATKEAKLGSGTLRFGYQPDEGGHYLLVQLIGVAKATDFLLRNKFVEGQEALDMGLVHEVVDRDQLQARAEELAQELAAGPQVAMRLLKRSLHNAATLSMEQAFEDIAVRTAISDYHEDAHEGRQSFVNRSKPQFNKWMDEA